MKVQEKIALKYLVDLLRIPGPPGDEAKVRQYIVSECLALGVPRKCISSDSAWKQSEYGGNTGNLYVRLDGKRGAERRLLATHMDTVPPAVGSKPVRKGNRIVNTAPGTALGGDARAGCAALLYAIRSLVAREGNHPPLTFLFTVQEEVGLVGARGLDLAALGPELPAMGFEFDGGPANELVTAIIGTERINIHVKGIAAHGSRPQKGVSAAMIEALALAELGRNGWFGYVKKREGDARTNLGILKGGTGSNVVMPELYALAEVRSHSRAFRKKVIRVWQKAFERAASRVRNEDGKTGRVSFTPGPTYEPFALAHDSPVVELAKKAARACGIRPKLITHDGGMDANHFVAFGIPTVSVGIGSFKAHSPDEYVDLRHFLLCCRLAIALSTV
ncbi:MAG: M20/M25/M40 family metallo-hydrolase [Kiritimatiellae bacterium]|nr:M20/M25/M40 family metallo-hydrolase [Kiritimatiellia bacterium]